MPIPNKLRLVAGVASVLILPLSPASLFADNFAQTNLVSDVPGLAVTTDPNLVNPWGLSFSATSPFWAADQGTGVSTLYNGVGTPNAMVVTIPGSVTGPTGPTGTVFNSAGAGNFVVGAAAASFLFDTLNGTIAAWNSGAGTTAVTMVTTPGAVYTGLALGSSGGSNYLYAADSTGQIRVFNSSFAPVTLSGNFADPNLPAGYVPYNIQLINGNLYVTYADLSHGVPVAGSTGFVDEYDTSGNLLQRVASGGALDAPWGITLAPASFGSFGNDLLVGNFGNGEIDAYSLSGVFEGTLDGTNGLPLVNQDLWALDFRTGGTGDNTNALYFTAGIDNQQEGLFGEITETPEPSSFVLAGLGILALAMVRLRQQSA